MREREREREGFMKRKTIEDYLWYYAETIQKNWDTYRI